MQNNFFVQKAEIQYSMIVEPFPLKYMLYKRKLHSSSMCRIIYDL